MTRPRSPQRRRLRLALGPLLYFWPAERVRAFYAEVEAWPVDIVYLGETVCAKRRALSAEDWHSVAERLAAAGKEVVLSTLALFEAESELSALERLCRERRGLVEANDMAAVHLLAGRGPFVAGPHLNVYNAETLMLLAELGARRWVPPLELSQETLAELQSHRPPGLATEVFAFGRLPLAFSARCFTARAHDLPKDACGFRCRDYPDGLALYTQDDRRLFTVNGTQLQSGTPCNLLQEVPRLVAMGVDVLRISPQARGTDRVVEAFRAALDPRPDPHRACARLPAPGPEGWCNGYWHGTAGMHWIPPE